VSAQIKALFSEATTSAKEDWPSYDVDERISVLGDKVLAALAAADRPPTDDRCGSCGLSQADCDAALRERGSACCSRCSMSGVHISREQR